jgi:hypothetical protein
MAKKIKSDKKNSKVVKRKLETNVRKDSCLTKIVIVLLKSGESGF